MGLAPIWHLYDANNATMRYVAPMGRPDGRRPAAVDGAAPYLSRIVQSVGVRSASVDDADSQVSFSY